MPKPTYPYKIRISLTESTGTQLQRLSTERDTPVTALIRQYVETGLVRDAAGTPALDRVTLAEEHVRALQLMASREERGPVTLDQLVGRIISLAIENAGITYAPRTIGGRLVLIPVDVED